MVCCQLSSVVAPLVVYHVALQQEQPSLSSVPTQQNDHLGDDQRNTQGLHMLIWATAPCWSPAVLHAVASVLIP